MEALGGVSAIFAVITFSLQTAKLIKSTISDLRDGPAVCQQLSTRITSLRKVLKLIGSLESKISANLVLSSTFKEHFEDAITACDKDLTTFRGKIEPLIAKDRDHFLLRSWKRLSIFVHEKDLDKIVEQLLIHHNTLQSRLPVFGLYVKAVLNQVLKGQDDLICP
jgi:hypothetical protein